MAKKETPKQEPVVSSLPLPQSETPLVIDLPDGQKLVVGKMQTGTVIEVATWRGTGRPDSRTNRMMLGVSVAGQTGAASTDSSQNSSAPTQNPPVSTGDPKTKALALLNKLLVKFKSIKLPKVSPKKLKSETGTKEVNKSLETKTALVPTSKPSNSDSEFDVDEWLSRIQEKNAAKAAKIDLPSVKKSAQKQVSARKTTKKPAAKKSKR